jgi:hypothetical protein
VFVREEYGPIPSDFLEVNKRASLEFNKKQMDMTAANCWHMNDVESDAMWKIYSAHQDGICIQSTYKKLQSSFDICNERDVFIGIVKYIDYNQHTDIDWVPTLKRISFQHERELRALIQAYEPRGPSENRTLSNLHTKEKSFALIDGEMVKADVENLIESVYVNPLSGAWFREAVQEAIRRFGFDFQTIQSDLMHGPSY